MVQKASKQQPRKLKMSNQLYPGMTSKSGSAGGVMVSTLWSVLLINILVRIRVLCDLDLIPSFPPRS